MKNLVGQTFGKLLVVRKASKIPNHSLWACVCECGGYKIVRGSNLTDGVIEGCGDCQKDKSNDDKNKTDKKEKKETSKNKMPPEYGVWSAMISRCHSPGNPAYKYYGGRGITVCARWRNSFKDFLEDVGFRPSTSHSLDRLKGSLGYRPGNVKWVTIEIQARNKKKFTNNTSGKTGVFFEKRRKTWVASIIDLQGKKYQKGFSIKKFGMMPAYAMACILRDELVAELNSQGAGYSIYHGL